jgi:hypothetical protein
LRPQKYGLNLVINFVNLDLNLYVKFGYYQKFALPENKRVKLFKCCSVNNYGRLWSFKSRVTKLERFLPKNQRSQRNLLNFENWYSGELQGDYLPQSQACAIREFLFGFK